MVGNIAHLRGHDNNWADYVGILRACRLGAYADEGRGAAPCEDIDLSHLLYMQYIPSVYWAMTVLTTTGYGDIVPVDDNERIFTLFVFIIVIIVAAIIMMYIEEIVALLDVTSSIKSQRENKIQSFLSRELSGREDITSDGTVNTLITKYFERLWLIQRGASPSEIKEFLCPRIYSNSVLRAIERSLDSIFYLKNTSNAFRNRLCSAMKMNVYVTGEYIFHKNELSRKLIVLFDGEISLVDDESGLIQKNEDDDLQRFSYTKKSSQKSSKLKSPTLSTTSSTRGVNLPAFDNPSSVGRQLMSNSIRY